MNQDSFSTTPTSISEPLPDRTWLTVSFDILDLFNSQFPSDNKLLTTSYHSASSSARVLMEHAILKRNRDRKTNFKTDEQLHIQAETSEKNFFWSKVTPETIKLHFTYGTPFGLQSLGGRIWKVYTSVGATRHLLNPSFKVGILGKHPNSDTFLDLRLRYNVGQFNSENYFYCKGGWQWEGLVIGGFAAFDVKRILLQKNNLKIGYQVGESAWVGAQLEVDVFRNYKINYWRLGGYFDLLRLLYVQKFQENKWICGLKFEHNIESSELKKIEAVIEHRPNSSGEGVRNLKARISSTLEVALAGSYSISRDICLGWGVLWGRMVNWNLVPSSVSLSFSFGKE